VTFEEVVMDEDNYQPRPSDLVWTKNMINQMNQDGTWAVPMNQTVYVFHHDIKELHLVEGDIDYLFERVSKNFAYYGWKVLDKRAV
jgi:hypothetical protein